MDEYFKVIKVGLEYASTQSIAQVGKNINKAFESSSIGSVLAAGFNAVISHQNPLKATFDVFLKEFSETVNSSIDRMDELLLYSKMSNSQVRELKMGYGFTSSEAYGYQTAMDVMGFDSMEDLMYANNQELQLFGEAFTKYSDYYTQLYDSGFFEDLQEYQFEMKMFKLEMEHEIITFFMNNKDTIMAVMKFIIDSGEVVIDILSWIVDFLGTDGRTDREKQRVTRDIINQYSTSNSSSTSMNMTNNFYGSQEQTGWMQNAGQTIYKQAISALE